jgi:hypothetical protein
MMAVRSASSERPRWRPPTRPRAEASVQTGQGGKQVEDEPALGRGRVDGIGKRH